MDVRMERMDGITATALVKELPNPPGVIALTSFDSEATILDAVSVGVDGFLAKDSDPGEFVRAVRRVAAGEGWLSSRATRVVMESTRRGGRANSAAVQSRVSLLTSRELEAVRWLVTEGCSNADIAASMFISETSVKTHLGNAATKLGAKNRTHLAALAVQAGLAN
jgi:DNA-binding NarL/FixJ family response regulator